MIKFCLAFTCFFPPAALYTYFTRLFFFPSLLIKRSNCKPFKDQHKQIIELKEGEFLLMHSTHARPLVEIICWFVSRLFFTPTIRNRVICRAEIISLTCYLECEYVVKLQELIFNDIESIRRLLCRTHCVISYVPLMHFLPSYDPFPTHWTWAAIFDMNTDENLEKA